jgi:glucosamine--fructose-6-phosphate aminotransferase (isomerizing)
VSQSGETLDTLVAVRAAREAGATVLSIANVLESAIPRASHGALYTHAGPEIGVASTKCFTTQLVAFLLLSVYLGRRRGTLTEARARDVLQSLVEVPGEMRRALESKDAVAEVARRFHQSEHVLFLGRGLSYPIALEGALKLKEISYAHAEGYAAGEMKHGPIALIDENLPVVTIAPQDHVFEKMIGNMQEAKARGGSIIALTTKGNNTLAAILDRSRDVVIEVPQAPELLLPIVMVVPLQLLAYSIAVRRGCDVDQPRNLAKSVTVE